MVTNLLWVHFLQQFLMAIMTVCWPGHGHSPFSICVDDDRKVVHDSYVHKLFRIIDNIVYSFDIQDSVLWAEEFR